MRFSLWWLSLLVCLFVLLPFTQPHRGPRFSFKNKPEYRLYLSPPFLYKNNTHLAIPSDFRCHKDEMMEHGVETLIPHLLQQIKRKGEEEGFPFRHSLSKTKIVDTPEEADLIIIQHKLKAILGGEKNEKVVLGAFKEHIRKIPSKCGGCDFVMIYSSGGCMGLSSLKKWFPRMISVGVDGGSLMKKTDTKTLTLPIPYPFTPCDRHHPEIPTYPRVSPFLPRPRLLFFFSIDQQHQPLPPNITIDPQSNAYRSIAIDSINSQAQQKGLGEDIVFVKRPKGNNKSKIRPKHFILSSNFCLCPRGITPASQRMIHVASLGCIPVILSDEYVPPFSAYIAPFYVQIKQNEVGTLLDQLMALKEEDVRQLKTNLKQYVQTWMWTWRPNENNLPLGLFLHQLFALGDLNMWMDNDGKRDREFPFENDGHSRESFLLPSSLDKKMAKFYFSLVNMTQPQSNLSVPLTLSKLTITTTPNTTTPHHHEIEPATGARD